MAITPYLLYRDAGAAIGWLAKAFGLRKTRHVFRGEDGRVNHATMTLGEAVLMLGSPGADFQGPRAIGHVTQNLYVDVDDVDKHYARAVKAGAKVIEEPKDTFYGARRYGAEDLEGHHWYFAEDLASARKRRKTTTRTRAVTPKKKPRGRKRSKR